MNAKSAYTNFRLLGWEESKHIQDQTTSIKTDKIPRTAIILVATMRGLEASQRATLSTWLLRTRNTQGRFRVALRIPGLHLGSKVNQLGETLKIPSY
jgi:hypothetical protein